MANHRPFKNIIYIKMFDKSNKLDSRAEVLQKTLKLSVFKLSSNHTMNFFAKSQLLRVIPPQNHK